jgi:peptidoglycan/LPS O-acetylase OafA/YrhL
VLGFLLGAAVGIAFNSGVRLSGLSATVLAAIGFGVVFLIPLPAGAESDLLPRLASAVPAVLILIAFALGPQADDNRRIWIAALLIGDASYSLYLVHAFVLRALSMVWMKGPLGALSLWTFIPIGMAIALLIALATYWCFEAPATRWLNRKTPRRAVRSEPAPGRDGAAALAK